ncbi:hypothetical protein DRQ33_04905 [bacterium]|nr:MAG: hypothetical protein DRQ33_04905 [bacterium]
MKGLFCAVIIITIMGAVFGGTVSGRLIFETTEPSSAQGIAAVLTEGQMHQLASGELDYEEIAFALLYSPPWNFTVSGSFSDDSLYYAFGIVVADDSSLEGNPMGVYPLSPFHTNGGSYEGVEIPVDDTIDLNIIIHPGDIEFTNIYAIVMDMSSALFSGTTELDTDFVVPIFDTLPIIENVPSGLKQVLVFKDENGNELYDAGEPFAYCESIDTPFVFAAAGVPDSMIAQAFLNEWKVKEHKPMVKEISLRLYPSPFNSELLIEADLPEGKHNITITDISGRVVHHSEMENSSVYKWNPQDLTSGIYNVRIRGDNFIVEKNAVYLK